MITNRDEVLDNAFRVFVRMNYEKASFTEIAKDSGELRPDTDVRKSAVLFRQTFMGMGYEHSFLNGLDIAWVVTYWFYYTFIVD